uniref:Uncharacterized protein n=1 Tax=Rhizophora mucronata TaxID=61149 RepID=A0A2P2QWY8_RHIMU
MIFSLSCQFIIIVFFYLFFLLLALPFIFWWHGCFYVSVVFFV